MKSAFWGEGISGGPREGGLENGKELHTCIALQLNHKGSNSYLLSYLEVYLAGFEIEPVQIVSWSF